MKKTCLHPFIGMVVGASGLQAARMLRSELKNRHIVAEGLSRLEKERIIK